MSELWKQHVRALREFRPEAACVTVVSSMDMGVPRNVLTEYKILARFHQQN